MFFAAKMRLHAEKKKLGILIDPISLCLFPSKVVENFLLFSSNLVLLLII